MELTTKQTAAKLGMTPALLRKWTIKGIIPSLTKSENGKRMNYLYDSATISKYIKENGQPKKTRRSANTNESVGNAQGFMSNINNRLDAIESKLDQLIGIWK